MVLHHPAGFRPQDSRILFHETVHFWQHLGQGYLLLRVDEDWQRLREFGEARKTPAPGPMKQHFAAPPADLGFSASDLHEALARFWDVHVLGPDTLLDLEIRSGRRAIAAELVADFRKAQDAGWIRHAVHGGYSDLAYDLAMEAAAGNYGLPYLLLRRQVSPVFAGVVFPLAGHMAFKSRDPVRRFRRIVDTLAGGAFPDVQPGRAVNELWEEHYLLVCSVAREIAESEGEATFAGTPAHMAPEMAAADIENIDALDADLLAGHPVYGWARKSLQRMAAALAWCDFEPAFLTEMKSSSRISHAPPRGFSSSTSSWLARGVPSGPSGRFSRVRFNG